MPKEKKDSFEKDFDLFSKSCEQKKLRLTPLRAAVWECLQKSKSPVGAYDIVKMLENTRLSAPPVSVYRTLDFLCENDFAHRLPESGSYVLCRSAGKKHAPVFLMCATCGEIEEIETEKVFKELKKAAGRFKIKSVSAVVQGVCAQCRK